MARIGRTVKISYFKGCLLTKLNIFLPYDIAITLLVIYSKELKTHVHTKATKVFFSR